MPLSGSLSAPGSSALLTLKPQQSFVLVLSVDSDTQFEGTVQLEESPNQEAWTPSVDLHNAVLRYTYAEGTEAQPGAIVTATVKNVTTGKRFYRVTAPVVNQDPVVYRATENTDDVVAVILRDHRGLPALGVRQDGSVQALAKVWAPNGVTVDPDDVQVADVTIAAADITGTSAGQLGHANGVPLVAAPGADVGLEFVSALLIYDFDTHGYGSGGNLSINVEAGGAALTGVVSAANSLGAAADKVAIFRPLATAAEVVVANKGINLVAASAFTVSSSSAGVLRLRVRYRLHPLGLA